MVLKWYRDQRQDFCHLSGMPSCVVYSPDDCVAADINGVCQKSPRVPSWRTIMVCMLPSSNTGRLLMRVRLSPFKSLHKQDGWPEDVITASNTLRRHRLLSASRRGPPVSDVKLQVASVHCRPDRLDFVDNRVLRSVYMRCRGMQAALLSSDPRHDHVSDTDSRQLAGANFDRYYSLQHVRQYIL